MYSKSLFLYGLVLVVRVAVLSLGSKEKRYGVGDVALRVYPTTFIINLQTKGEEKMKLEWNNEQKWQNISYVLFFIGGVLALYAGHTDLLLFIIIAILLMDRGI